MLRLWGRVAIGMLLLLQSVWAWSHDMPSSEVAIRVLPDHWQITLNLPEDRLVVALAQAKLLPLSATLATAITLDPRMVQQYVAPRLQVSNQDGRKWQTRILSLEHLPSTAASGINDWRIQLEAIPPNARLPEQAILTDEVIGRELITHTALVYLAQDWQRGFHPDQPQLLGALRAHQHQITIERKQGHAWQAYWSMFKLGCVHILQGLDHLSFLLLLIIAAPLRRSDQCLQLIAQQRDIWRSIALNISMFTLGHLSSLLLVSLGIISVWINPAWIEVWVALSVLGSATLLLFGRPIDQWPVVVLLFGLIHGCAFAEVMHNLSLPLAQSIAAIISFNLGIELVQLMLVLAILPLLIFCLRQQLFTPRLLQAISGLVLGWSMVWVFERLMALS